MLTTVTTATLTFFGCSDSQGVPRWWCACPVCEEARRDGRNRRTRPSCLFEGAGEHVLLDAAPEFRLQASRHRLKSLDAVLVTHAHNDHVAGLPDVGDFTRWTGARCPVYAPAEVASALQARYGYLFAPGSRFTGRFPLVPLEEAHRSFAGYTLTAVKVPHGFNGHSYAFRFEREGRTWGYMPDCLGLEDLAPWRELELLVLGTSFYREDAPLESRSVYDVQEALELLSELRPKRAIFTHLGHGVDVSQPVPEGTGYAFDGMEVVLP
jgi:phosphoribosyl 1,2-cyclic phosphate phosphodiesterase